MRALRVDGFYDGSSTQEVPTFASFGELHRHLDLRFCILIPVKPPNHNFSNKFFSLAPRAYTCQSAAQFNGKIIQGWPLKKKKSVKSRAVKMILKFVKTDIQ